MDSLLPLSRQKSIGVLQSDDLEERKKCITYFSRQSIGSSLGLIGLLELLQDPELNLQGPVTIFPPSHSISEGAQFKVFRGSFVPDFRNTETEVALKQPKYFLEADQTLNLASKKAQQHLQDVRREILALCHPVLRSHRNIIRILAWGFAYSQWHEPLMLIQELALSDLADYLKQHGSMLSWLSKQRICLDVGAGLDALHSVYVTHGDLKPANVLVCDENGIVAKLADFGMSYDTSHKAHEVSPQGTLGWQAPEIQAGKARQHELPMSDNYTFGLLIWSVMFLGGEAVPGRGHKDLRKLIKDHNNKQEDLPSSSYSAIKRATLALLQENPSDRPDVLCALLNDGSGAYQEW